MLLKKRLITIPLLQCNKTILEYTKGANETVVQDGINAVQYCVQFSDRRNDSCDGSSDGRLKIISPFTTLPKIVGIALIDVDCATTLPSVYTRVAYYVKWIQPVIWLNGDVPTIKNNNENIES